ncbi:MAG: ChbG/HpnK family deacetylase [Dermatophilaceae bacterium]
MTRRFLVVNADDLGLTRGINRGIRDAHLNGVVTSTSLLTVAREVQDAVAMLHATPSLDVGLHLALVGEDPPVLTAREVPTLVDRRGSFPLTYRQFLLRAAAGRVDVADVAREFAAQAQLATSKGLQLSHLDSHQHVHLWPPVASAVIDLARTLDIPYVRLPRAHGGGPLNWGVNALSTRLRRQLRAARLPSADFSYAGLDEAGSMGRDAFRRALEAVARSSAPIAEINVHPGYADADSSRFEWDYHWDDEVAALVDARTAADIAGHGFTCTSFADLPGRRA